MLLKIHMANAVVTTTTQVNAKFQATPLQDIPDFTGAITVPGVGEKIVQKLIDCNITSPSALVGQFMVSLSVSAARDAS